ncbi:hypothetical protein CVD19_22940 [Bacillus sp. T33-2]|nr:hypothetical protein CVD19_22940 [Bacillus sp. T33-2]
MPGGDRHKTRRREGCSLAFFTDWLMTRSQALELDKTRPCHPLAGSCSLIIKILSLPQFVHL